MRKLLGVVFLVGMLCMMGLGCEEEVPPAGSLEGKVASLEGRLGQLESQVAGIPDVSGDVSALRTDLETLKGTVNQLQGELSTLNVWLNQLEDQLDLLGEEDEEEEGNEEIEETTRWNLEAWTDYVSSGFLDVRVDSKRIEDEDNYTIYLLLYNTSIGDGGKGTINKGTETARLAMVIPIPEYLYYETDTGKLWEVVGGGWVEITNFASIYNQVTMTEITLSFRPKSGDRVVVDEIKTYLESYGWPYFDWDIDFTTRDDGTCRRMEATTFTRFEIPVPEGFYNNDPTKPHPFQLRLEFELTYK